MQEYEVVSNYGCALFKDEQDAMNAFFLLGAYHEIKIDKADVKKNIR